MEEKYICVQSFCVNKVDDDGFTVPNEEKLIEKGEVFALYDGIAYMTGADVRMENENGWIEIPRDCFETMFKKIKS